MRIANAYDMLYYADMLETRPNLSAQLECDVRMVCSELVPFQSMAGTQAGFAGTFDGQDHTIRQLRVLTPSGGYTALFAKTETGAVIRNLKIEAEFTPEVGSFAPVEAITAAPSKSARHISSSRMFLKAPAIPRPMIRASAAWSP